MQLESLHLLWITDFKTNTLKNYYINTSDMSEQKCMQNVNINLYT